MGVAVEGGLDCVSADPIRAAAEKAGLDPATTAALVEDYSTAQLGSLKVGLLAAALLALLAVMSTRGSRTIPPAGHRKEEEDPELSPSPA